MADTVADQLPRGRHRLSRAEVEQNQRIRIVMGMADAMGANGYVGTPVAEIIRRAGVSRETFYQLYPNKLDCFLDAFDFVGEILIAHLAASLTEPGTPIERFERALTTYLETLASQPGYARLFLVEVYAAGPQAMTRRLDIQQRIVDALVELLDAHSDAGRFECQILVSAVSAMVTGPLVAGDVDALRAVGPPILDHVHRLDRAGVFAPSRA